MSGKIMVVDDDPSIVELVSEILKNAGYPVCAASNMQDADKILQQENIVLAVLDIYLPDGTGLDLAGKIKSAGPTIPVIIMTGTPAGDNVQQSVAIEVDAYLVKPVNAEDLISLVEELI